MIAKRSQEEGKREKPRGAQGNRNEVTGNKYQAIREYLDRKNAREQVSPAARRALIEYLKPYSGEKKRA